ncbi:MAG: metallophosphoesterase [Actinomycetia bacterium]|nr:metallophosphoesterase [Actinomycetes bacterium]
MTVLGLAGDWHGNYAWAAARVMSMGERGVRTVLHVGDFGIWPGRFGKKFLLDMEAVCARYGVHLWVTPGNHEDWGRLCKLWENDTRIDAQGRLLPVDLSDHIRVLPRGHRWEIDGRSFVSLGGAPSVDYLAPFRKQGETWWAEETVTATDVERTVSGGYADVMIAHDAPDAPYQVAEVAGIVAGNPVGWADEALAYAAVGRRRMHEAFLGVAPRLFVHGHYHVAGQASFRLPGCAYETRIWSLAMDGTAGNVRLLDLETLRDPSPGFVT